VSQGVNVIEKVSKGNLEEVLPLFRAYQDFYKVQNACDKKNREFLSRLCESSELGSQFIFRKNGKVVGFATVYFTFTSTIASKVAILNDLYTLPENDAARLQWVTAPENEPAQKLYDSMGLSKSSWYFYTYNT
jgi:hypothetical protein